MSRESIKVGDIEFAFGVDHAIGKFFQVFCDNNDEVPLAAYSAKYGVSISNPEKVKKFLVLAAAMQDLQNRRLVQHPNLTEEDVIRVGCAIGISGVDRKKLIRSVYELWD